MAEMWKRTLIKKYKKKKKKKKKNQNQPPIS